MEPFKDARSPSPFGLARTAWRPPWRAARTFPPARLLRAVPLIATAAWLVAVPLSSSAAQMLVLQSGDTPRLARTLNVLRESAGMPVEVITLDGARTDVLAARMQGERGTIIVALGPRASDFAVRFASSGSVVHCLAGADAIHAGLPAIPSEAPLERQAAWLHRLVPGTKTVGLLFDPALSARRAQTFSAAFASAGFETLLQPVATPSAIPAALEHLVGRADVLMAIPDPMVYTRESARGILLFSFRKRIPLIGANDAWVRMGALFALDWDYAEVGESCARLALRESQASKTTAGAAPILPRPRVSVNLRSAQQFGLNWDAELLRSVDQRHE